MSVETEADRQIYNAREHTKKALFSLNKIIVLECSGSDEYNHEFHKKIKNAHALLIKTRELLK